MSLADCRTDVGRKLGVCGSQKSFDVIYFRKGTNRNKGFRSCFVLFLIEEIPFSGRLEIVICKILMISYY